MCTSIITNKNNTIVGFNLDVLNMTYRIKEEETGVFIEIEDFTWGWLPLFGVNRKGEFVAMPTCWPYDARSNNQGLNVMNLDIDVLLEKRSFEDVVNYIKDNEISSNIGNTFMSQISNKNGDVIQIVPGQGYKIFNKPEYSIMTNFSPFKMFVEEHEWMGKDRYLKAKEIIEKEKNIDACKMFGILKEVSQTICPTVVSMVYDAGANEVCWCENRDFTKIKRIRL